MSNVDLDALQAELDRFKAANKSLSVQLEQAEDRIGILEGQLADRDAPEEVYEEGCSPSIMDADGLPRAMAEIMRGKGNVHCLTNLYLLIDTWAEHQRQYAVRRAFKEAASTHSDLSMLERFGYVECDITSDLEFKSFAEGDFVKFEDAQKLVAMIAEKASAKPAFTVQVDKMTESHRETFWVRLTNNALRPAEPDGFMDETGQITPSYFENPEHAQHTAAEWAAFLGVPEQVKCTCIMCDFPRRSRKSAKNKPANEGDAS
jgi:uncharacterized protein YchJ